MYPRRMLTTVISELVALAPDDAVAALDVHRLEGVLAGLWSVNDRANRLTFIGVPTWRAYFEDMNSVVVPVRIVFGRSDVLAEVEIVPHSHQATELRLALVETANRRTERRFDGNVDVLRGLMREFAAGLLDASTRTHEPHDLFADSDLLVA
jgi:hypothetical protein